MLKPLRIKTDADNVLFWSDMHIGHAKPWIYAARGFKTVAEHDDTLVHRWNEACTDRSVVFHLGDLVFGDPEGKRFEELTRRLRFGTLYVMLGNHISGHRQVYQRVLGDGLDAGEELYPLTWDLGHKRVVFLPQYAEATIAKQSFILCHYAIEAWNGGHKDAYHLHGHSHGNLITKRAHRRDVGVDCYARPVSAADLLREMRDEKPDVVDHHGADSP